METCIISGMYDLQSEHDTNAAFIYLVLLVNLFRLIKT